MNGSRVLVDNFERDAPSGAPYLLSATYRCPSAMNKSHDFSRCLAAEIAGIHRVSVRTVSRWRDEGLPQNGDGSYDAGATVQWRLAREQVADLTAERAQLENARRRKLELEIAALEGDLLPAEQVKDALNVMITNCRARLLAIPHALAPALRPDDPQAAHALLESSIHEALHELADRSLGVGNDHG